MYQENIIDMLMRKMIHFNQNDPQRIHHLIKVHSFAQMIGRMEQLDGHKMCIRDSPTAKPAANAEILIYFYFHKITSLCQFYI